MKQCDSRNDQIAAIARQRNERHADQGQLFFAHLLSRLALAHLLRQGIRRSWHGTPPPIDRLGTAFQRGGEIVVETECKGCCPGTNEDDLQQRVC